MGVSDGMAGASGTTTSTRPSCVSTITDSHTQRLLAAVTAVLVAAMDEVAGADARSSGTTYTRSLLEKVGAGDVFSVLMSVPITLASLSTAVWETRCSSTECAPPSSVTSCVAEGGLAFLWRAIVSSCMGATVASLPNTCAASRSEALLSNSSIS